jgi:hypothetical protein
MNRIAKIALRAARVLLILVAILYAGDYVSVKYRMSRAGSPPSAPGGPLDTVQIQRTYEIPHKDGRAEFAFAEPQTVTCVHSIFPHLGYSPCWYLKRHSQQMIPM